MTVILVGLVLTGVLFVRQGPSFFRDWQHPDWFMRDIVMEESRTGIDFSVAPRTLVMALQTDCQFCQESMPFYRRLLERDTSDVQIVVAAPSTDRGIGDYLASENVVPDSIVFVGPTSLPVSGTPTLLLADSEGLVTHLWFGQVAVESEAEVFDAVFGD